MLSPRKTEEKEEKEKQETMPIEEAEHTLDKKRIQSRMEQDTA